MTRAERRRMEREIQKTKPAAGAGQGWRLSCGRARRRYPVIEPGPIDVGALEEQSRVVRARMGTVPC